jgi:hypothetical protein
MYLQEEKSDKGYCWTGDGSILYKAKHYASKTIKTAKDTTGWMPVTWRVGNRHRTTDTVLT